VTLPSASLLFILSRPTEFPRLHASGISPNPNQGEHRIYSGIELRHTPLVFHFALVAG
jgi:hypothetical protein